MIPRTFLVALALCSCATPFHATPPTGDEVTIFLPGYEGSFLATDSLPSKIAWITPAVGLFGGKETLALPFEGERPVPTFGPLHSEGPLTRLTFIPVIAEGDIYGSWLEYGTKTLPGFIPFGYDWRQDMRTTAGQLSALIDRLSAEHGGRLKVNLIGHSMGGLVALYYLRYGADFTAHEVTWAGARHVQRVAFVGTPFRGAPGVLEAFIVGTPAGLNHALMSKEAIFTFPAAYQFMGGSDDFFQDAAGAPVHLAAGDASTWCEQGWSVFSDAKLCGDFSYQQQLTRMLRVRRETSAAFADVTIPPPVELQALVVIGHGRATTVGERVVEGRVDVEHPVRGDGDETVAATSAVPPKPLTYALVETSARHVALLNDDEVRKAIAHFVGR
jgi:pimeloyl-ACP methyl ester carboxylesterase